MFKSNTNEILSGEEFSAFYESSINFCNFIETDRSNNNYDFLRSIRIHLLELYRYGLKLQYVNLQSNIEYSEKLEQKDIEKIYHAIESKLGNKRYYWLVLDLMIEKDNEPVCGDLLDDLTDIYKDLKYSIMIFNLNKQDCQENAIWQFKFDFEKHWGNHCINALNAIHYFLVNSK